MKLKKGSKEAKEYMAKIRAKKGTTKKVVAKKTIAKKVGATSNKIKFNFDVYKLNEFGDTIPSSKKRVSIIRAKQNSAEDAVYKKYSYKNHRISLHSTEYIGYKSNNTNNFMGNNLENTFYIDYLNKKKNKRDRIFFNSFEEAVKWANKNLYKNYNIDNIKVDKKIVGSALQSNEKSGAVTKSKNVVNNLSNQSVHILFLNKNKGFQKDKKVFKNYNDAVKWGKKNLDNFNLDMIKFGIGSALKLNKKEYRLGMPPKTTSNNANGYHKDTKSHNVNIRVVSGSPRLSIIEKKQDVLDRIKHLVKYNNEVEQLLLRWKDRLKTDKSKPFVDFQKKGVQENVKKYTVLLKSNKKYLSELKKLI